MLDFVAFVGYVVGGWFGGFSVGCFAFVVFCNVLMVLSWRLFDCLIFGVISLDWGLLLCLLGVVSLCLLFRLLFYV